MPATYGGAAADGAGDERLVCISPNVTALDAATPAACGVVGLEGIEVLRKPVVPPRLREAIESRLENSLPAMLETA